MDRNFDKVLKAKFYGFNAPYKKSISQMHALVDDVFSKHKPPSLMLLEHEPVITFTRQHEKKSIISSDAFINQDGIALALTDRGGDVTFHGPGQLVGYPIIPIEHRYSKNAALIDISHYIRNLEHALLNAVKFFGVLNAQTFKGFTGIWIKTKSKNVITLKKLIAIGAGIKNGISKHGFALNIDIDYKRYTRHIVPCGLKDRGVITLKEALSQSGLEMPRYFDIVHVVSKCIAQQFSYSLCFNNDELIGEQGNGKQNSNAPTWRINC